MGADVQIFKSILVPFTVAWDFATIPRTDVNSCGEHQQGHHSLNVAGNLELLFHFLSSIMAAYTLQKILSIMAIVFFCVIYFIVFAWNTQGAQYFPHRIAMK